MKTQFTHHIACGAAGILLLSLLFGSDFSGMSAVQAETAYIRQAGGVSGTDSIQDNPTEGLLDKDDFETLEEWEAYQKEHPTRSARETAVTPKLSMDVEVELQYTITGLPKSRAIQKSYIDDTCIYVTQRVDATTYLSRCKIDIKTGTAECQDYMVLENFGHGQTLEGYTYHGKQYFWISCKANENYDNKWAMQIGRIQYEGGKTYSDYTQVSRFTDLNFANEAALSFGSVKRVDAALSNDGTKLLLWVQNTENVIQYSYFDANVMNDLLDAVEEENEETENTDLCVSFENNEILQNVCYGSFEQATSAEKTLPNGSNQGIEISDWEDIYIVGGKAGETPKMTLMRGQGYDYEWEYLVSFTNEAFGSKTEIEGIQLEGDMIYVGVCDHDVKKTEQYIYGFQSTAVEAAISDHIWDDGTVTKEPTCTEAGDRIYNCSHCVGKLHTEIPATGHGETEIRNQKEVTCTEDGYSGDFYCTVCDTKLEEGQTIPAQGHQWDNGKVTMKATAVAVGTEQYQCTVCGETKTEILPALGLPKKGTSLTVGKAVYKVTKSAAKNGTVRFMKTSSTANTITIPDTIQVSGVTYKVTSIAPSALRSNTKIRKLTVGANVDTIGKLAFYGCKNLKTIIIKTKKLTSKSIGSKALKNIYVKASIQVPKKKLTAYKTILKKAGITSKAKIKGK
jgi:hypothetical protein